MNVLFLNRNFYEYDCAIKRELIANGCQVYDYSIKAPRSAINDFFSRIIGYKLSYGKRAMEQQKKIITDLKNRDISIDYVLVVSGQELCKQTLEELRKLYPNARFVWYIWDAMYRIKKDYKRNKSLFDDIISFDIKEAKEYNIDYLPLFFIHEIKQKQKDYDLSFIGAGYSNRDKIINGVFNKINPKKTYIFIKGTRILRLKYLFINNSVKKYIKNDTLPYQKTLEIMSRSKCILDIPYKGQSGLTIRTIESIGLHTKLITTNKSIREYDFYDENNIFIMDLKNNILPQEDFFENEYKEIDDTIFQRYNITYWTKKILDYSKG